VVEKFPFNDLAANKSAFQIKEHYPKLRLALLASMQRHNWYLSEQLVVLALADDDVSEEIKITMLQQLVGFDIPEQFRMGEPELPIITMSTQRLELIGPQSWLLLKVAEVAKKM
jgi:hypothetical protein